MERSVSVHPTVHHHHRRLRATSRYFTCASSPRVDLDHLRHSVPKSSALIQINLENLGDAKSFGCKILREPAMVEPGSPASSVHLPWFIAGPGQTDVLLVIMGVFLVVFTFLIGVLMLRLHHLPEHIAGKEQKIQYQFVAVLSLLAMF